MEKAEKKKRTDSEINKYDQSETEKVKTERPKGGKEAHAAEVPCPVTSRTVTLTALLAELEVPESRWPGEALKAVLGRFSSMPREGWHKCHSMFCDKFSSSVSLNEFTKRANSVITSNSGRKCPNRKFVEGLENALKQLMRSWIKILYRRPKSIRV